MPVDWDRILRDLAMHLASARQLDDASRILDDAKRDLGRLDCPVDFWKRLGSGYQNAVRRRLDSAGTDGLELETNVGAMIRKKGDA